MKGLVALAAAIAALAGAPSAFAAAPVLVSHVRAAPLGVFGPGAKAPQVVFRDLRVCSKATYQPARFRCLRNERSRLLVSEAAVCTIEILAYSAIAVRAEMRFAGGTQYARTTKVKKRTRLQLAFGVELPATMPAGSYTCTFSVGKKKASATVRSGGPAGSVVWTAACTTNLLRTDGTGCSSDLSAAPLPSTGSLSCSGWMVGQQGKSVALELFYNDNGVWTRLDGGEVRANRPISLMWFTVPSLLGGTFLPGQYACRFSVGGRLLGEKLFSVA